MKLHKIACFIMTTMILCSTALSVSALDDPKTDGSADINTINNTAENVIYELLSAMNDHDISRYIETQCEENKTDLERFFTGRDWEKDDAGVMCVENADLYEIKELPLDIASSYTSIYKYEEIYNDLKAYYVGIDYKVKNESKYFFNGVNYDLIVLGKENGEWKIVEESDAPIESLTLTKYKFGSSAENKALEIVKSRFDGVILNGEMQVISSVKKSEDGTIALANDSEHIKPDYIRVYRNASGNVQNVNLYSYVKNVLPNEWIPSWSSESLKTGAMACKMYGWYHHYHPKWSSLNADVKDTTADQVYKPNTENANTTAAINAVNGIGIHNSAGKIFETQYLAGTQGSAGAGNTGKISQWGSKYLAENGWTYMSICSYYYNVSDKSNQRISQFTY